MAKERILVTSALPYANGPLHVGHAIGAYIPADVYTRYHRLMGNDILFISGTDEYGTPIAVTAESEGVTPKEVVDKYHKIIENAFSKLGISFDNFSRTSSELHCKTSQEFFSEILKNGFIYKKTVKRPYCKRCKRFLPDRYVKGICPYCGSRDERGDQCESCGKQLEPHELLESYCAICHETPEQRETRHWFFKLSEFSQKLREWIEGNKHWPDNARNFSLSWISEGLEDRAITRDMEWGVPVPLKESKGKVLYVWFDAPIGYISSTKEWAQKINKPDEWKNYWIKDCKIVHFIGKDNIPFHAIIWPAMLMAHGNYNLPWQISSNEYLNLEGRKMSTSRNWVLWLHDILGEFDPDLIRYYLISINPARHDSDFSLKEFQSRVNSELIGTLGNFINRVLVFIEKNNGGVIPEPLEQRNWDRIEKRLNMGLIQAMQENGADSIESHLENFQFREALDGVMHMARFGNEYFQQMEPWNYENRRKTTLYFCANLVRTLAIVMFPFLPFSAEKVWRMLNLEGSVKDQKWESAKEFWRIPDFRRGIKEQGWESAITLGIEPNHKLGRVKPLYKKIEDKEIEAFGKKFLKLKPSEELKMDKVRIEDFKRMDLRIGRIKAVEDVQKADKLYLLRVDLGELGERQLVAKIKEFYPKEDLIGKQIVVIANLAPKKISGINSEGMLLAADVDGKPILLTTDAEVTAGARVG